MDKETTRLSIATEVLSWVALIVISLFVNMKASGTMVLVLALGLFVAVVAIGLRGSR
jgi:hypothetical protein